jgi:hypothetical protein
MKDGYAAMATIEEYLGVGPLKSIPQGAATTLAMMLDELPASGNEQLYYAGGTGSPLCSTQTISLTCLATATCAVFWSISEKRTPHLRPDLHTG